MGSNSHTSCLRLRRLQQVTKDLGLDGLIFVLGVDGSFNLGSQQAASFVLGQSSARDVLAGAGQHEGLGVLVVTPLDVRVFGESSQALPKQLLHPSLQLQVFTPTAAELEDPDACEAAKLGAFVQMMRGLQQVGMPVLVPPAGTAAAVIQSGSLPGVQPLSAEQLMQLERYPLLMAYGMEGVGRPTAPFFTQCFQVHDVYEALHACVYAHLDAAAVTHTLQQDAHHLQQHWADCIQGISSQPATGLTSLTERQVAEPLQAFFAHGLLRPLPGVPKDTFMPPRVVFGMRTNDEGSQTDAATMMSASSPAGPTATQLVLEAADGHSPLRVARTYFFSTAAVAPDVFADLDDEANEGFSYSAATAGWDPQPCKALMRVYMALVNAAKAGMQHFATQDNATAATVHQVMLDALAAHCAALGVPQPSLQQQLHSSLWQCDHANHVQAVAQRGTRQLKVLRVALMDVRGPADAAGHRPVLGGLVYADTFLEVPATAGQRAGLLVLTEAVPALIAWPGLGGEAVIMQRAVNSFAKAVAAAAGNKGDVLSAVAARRAHHRARQQQAALAQLALNSAKQTNNKPAPEADQDDEGVEDDQEGGDLAAHWPDQSLPVASAAATPLGALLTKAGGEEAVLLTGSEVAAAEPGRLHCFSHGLVFVPHTTRAVWVLNFFDSLEAISLQQLGNPSSATPAGTAQLTGGSECVVLRGKQPACGLAPACHTTTNTHVGIPIDALSQVARRHMLSVVLPAWQQTCREGVPPGSDPSEPAVPITYVKDAAAANPFSAACYPAHMAAVQNGGKSWQQVVTPDHHVDTLLSSMGQNEMSELCCGCWQQVEALLCSSAKVTSGQGMARTGITVLAGLPGSDQALVAAALVRLMGEAAAPQVVYVRGAASAATWQAAVSSGLAANNLSQHLVIVVEGFTPLLQHLVCLAQTQEVQQGRCYLACTLGCVGTLSLWQDKARGVLQPGLTAQLPAGVLDAVIISANSAAEYMQVQRALGTAAAGVLLTGLAAPHAVRGGTLPLLLQARELLVPDQQERLVRLDAQSDSRRWAYMARQASAGQALLPVAAPLHGPLQSVRLSFTGELDLQAFSEALQQLAGTATQTPAFPLQEAGIISKVTAPAGGMTGAWGSPQAAGSRLLGVAGVVRPCQGMPLQQLVWGLSAAGTSWELRATPSSLPQSSVVHGAPTDGILNSAEAAGGELLVWGTGLQPDTLQSVLKAASKAAVAVQRQQVAQQVVTPETLSAAQVAEVAEAHKHDPLPDGYTYDGSRYYDAFGDSSTQHPCFSQFLAEYCQLHNQQQQQVDDCTMAAQVHALQISAVIHQVLTT